MSRPLDGLLVADFSRVLAGPLATMHLADLGATVVKVERPGIGDETRTWGPPWTERSSAYFECVNRSKYSLALDLADPDDRARAVALAKRADVFVENFRPGALSGFALDYASVAADNPAIVYCSISGFGDGAGADLPGYDFLVQAVGGLMSITGMPDADPTKVGVALVDVLTGKDAVIGILSAVTARSRHGRGEHVQVDLLSSLLAGFVNQAAGYLTTGQPPGRMGNRHPSIAPYETLRCSDAMLAVACGNDGQFRRLAADIGRPELAEDPRFATNPARVAHRDELVDALETALQARTAAEWERRLIAVGVPAGQVGDIASGIRRAVDLGLEPLVEPGGGAPPQIRHPVRFDAATLAPASAPPAIGADQERMLAWLSADPRPLPHPADSAGDRP